MKLVSRAQEKFFSLTSWAVVHKLAVVTKLQRVYVFYNTPTKERQKNKKDIETGLPEVTTQSHPGSNPNDRKKAIKI